MQMNLRLSGTDGRYAKDYSAGVEDVIARIPETHPDAVTFKRTASFGRRPANRRQ